ncbi:MAG: PhzF family phenazine biosynthesis protein [Pseudomonadota bacterium]
MPPTISYRLYDVFTDERLAGNPLAVVDVRAGDNAARLDAGGAGDQLQAIAKEFNLSETVFLLSPANPLHTARLRIYTPDRELPFAGHPTVGAAVALARDEVANGLSDGLILMEEEIGLIRAAVRVPSDATDRLNGFAEFDLVTHAERFDWTPDRGDLALALGLRTDQVGFENHEPTGFDGGMPYFCVPVHDLAALNEVVPNGPLFAKTFAGGLGHDGVYIYTRETISAGAQFAARMMWPVGGSVREDPATGSAVASLAGAIMHFDAPMEGAQRVCVEQGYAMGRPSQIELELTVGPSGALHSARLGGNVVCLGEGVLYL